MFGAFGLSVGWIAGLSHEGAFDSIKPVRVRQYYGVAMGENEDGEYCIEHSSDGAECAVLRLEDDARLPEVGSPVRGGLTQLPSDTSDPYEPSWLWVTGLACGWEGTEGATACP